MNTNLVLLPPGKMGRGGGGGGREYGTGRERVSEGLEHWVAMHTTYYTYSTRGCDSEGQGLQSYWRSGQCI